MKASEWIDRAKAAKNWGSDYRAAKELGIKSHTISGYRANGTPMDETIALRVAHALEVSPALVLADQAMERAKDAEARGAWMSILERLGGVAAAILLTTGIVEIPNGDNDLQEQSNADQFIHRIK